jgi:hypothetical protein
MLISESNRKKEAIYHEKKLVERKRGISDLPEKF